MPQNFRDMSRGPLPTRLVFLTDTGSLAHGEKVRFLGWYRYTPRLYLSYYTLSSRSSTTRYDAASGTLLLKHNYPPQAPVSVSAAVDVNLLLSTLKSTDTQIGEWVNVVGYVQRDIEDFKRERSEMMILREGQLVQIQAIMLWSAGSINLGDYEKALEARNRIVLAQEISR